jgi:hypothetical protein
MIWRSKSTSRSPRVPCLPEIHGLPSGSIISKHGWIQALNALSNEKSLTIVLLHERSVLLTLSLLELALGLQPVVLVITVPFSARQIEFVGAAFDFFSRGFVEANALVV